MLGIASFVGIGRERHRSPLALASALQKVSSSSCGRIKECRHPGKRTGKLAADPHLDVVCSLWRRLTQEAVCAFDYGRQQPGLKRPVQ